MEVRKLNDSRQSLPELAVVGLDELTSSSPTGDLNPGMHADIAAQRQFANPAPLGLGAFALTTFVLSLINVKANNVTEPNLVIALALGYGGLIQLLAGMWEMAVGNTFGATALSSYGGFWISFGIVLTPAFNIPASYVNATTGASTFNAVFALYLWGWFVFTSFLLLASLPFPMCDRRNVFR